MSVCHIVGAGDFSPERFAPHREDLVIACDAGLGHLEKICVRPDLIVGDFDSYAGPRPAGSNVIVLPREKDDTDSVYAARLGLARGFSRFYLHGALGGERCSHTFANSVLLLWLSKQGAEGVLLGKNAELAVLHETTLRFPANARGYLSLFSLEEGCRVRIEGLKFPFDGQLDPCFPLGVSNEFTGNEARVTVCGGKALLIHEGDPLPAEIFLP